MPQFQRVEVAVASPTHCAFCGTGVGPFVDAKLGQLMVRTPAGTVFYEGAIYICTSAPSETGRSGCAEQIGGVAGTVEYRTVSAQLRERIAELERTVDAMADALGQAERERVVPLSEVKELAELLERARKPRSSRARVTDAEPTSA